LDGDRRLKISEYFVYHWFAVIKGNCQLNRKPGRYGRTENPQTRSGSIRFHFNQGGPGLGTVAYDWFATAMNAYGEALIQHAQKGVPSNDDFLDKLKKLQ